MSQHFNCKYTLAERRLAIGLFKTMTAREVAKKLGLTHGQVIGIMETSRRMGLIGHAFKDTRNKKPWSFKERLSLIRMAGLVNRAEIGKRLGRDGQRNIKERMKADFNSGTKFLHGMPLTWVKELIPIYIEDRVIVTTAGPNAVRGATNFRIVPWVELEHVAYAMRLKGNLSTIIKAMANFQRFIWQCDDETKIRKLLKGVVDGR